MPVLWNLSRLASACGRTVRAFSDFRRAIRANFEALLQSSARRPSSPAAFALVDSSNRFGAFVAAVWLQSSRRPAPDDHRVFPGADPGGDLARSAGGPSMAVRQGCPGVERRGCARRAAPFVIFYSPPPSASERGANPSGLAGRLPEGFAGPGLFAKPSL
jgi:hypothetical protein